MPCRCERYEGTCENLAAAYHDDRCLDCYDDEGICEASHTGPPPIDNREGDPAFNGAFNRW